MTLLIMPMVTIEKAMLDGLIDFKLKYLLRELQRILEHWRYRSADLFLANARDGMLKGAEMDAIALRQLLVNRQKLEDLRKK